MSPTATSVPENVIIVARNMGPAALLDYDRAKLRGLILEERRAGEPRGDRRARARESATVGLFQHHPASSNLTTR